VAEDSTDGATPAAERAAQILDALGDPTARRILVDGLEQPVTAEEVATAEDVSRSTIYRRIDTLRCLGLIEAVSGPRSRPGTGTRYRTVAETFQATVTASGFEVRTGSDVASDDLEPAVETLLDALDVTDAAFDMESGTVTVTLTDDDAFARVAEIYRASESAGSDERDGQ
jgi:DNA-binding transcriptional ArsR family regulator